MGNQPENDFLRLIQANRGILFKICNAYCKNKNDREDLAQEIIYQLWKSGKSFDANQRFSTWMYRVALNVAISWYRKQKQSPVAVSLTGNVDDLTTSAETANQKETDINRLLQYINSLPALDRALMLLYLEAKTYTEIADILGITVTNVATKINRIKDKLKLQFAESG